MDETVPLTTNSVAFILDLQASIDWTSGGSSALIAAARGMMINTPWKRREVADLLASDGHIKWFSVELLKF